MPHPTSRRRLLTVLFLDIVGSTPLAEQLGDARWRVVLGRFRDVVRSTIKRYGGRHEGTTGDGVLATFTEPAQALRAAAAITSAVQELGVDVRVGVHTGEVEESHGHLAGVGVHIGARVMALAGAAEVLTTSTVRELVTGSGAVLDPAGEHELRGVTGTWHVYRLRAVDFPLPPPLEATVATSRLERVAAPPRHRRRWAVAGVVAAIAAAAAVAGILATRGPAHTGPLALVAIDPHTGRIVKDVHDTVKGCPCGANLFAINGTLWEHAGAGGDEIAVRNMSSGAVTRVFNPPGAIDNAVGFGSVWTIESLYTQNGTASTAINGVVRRDELSGRKVAYIPLLGSLGQATIEVGNGAVWVLEANAQLLRIDPLTNKLTGIYSTGAIETGILLPTGGYEWICECVGHEVLRYDARTQTSKTFHFSEEPWHLVTVPTPHGETLWLLDNKGATLTKIDPRTGRSQQPLGVDGEPTQAVEFDGSIWIAAGRVVDRVRLGSDQRSTIQLPPGVNGTGIAADSATGRLWVDNSYRAAGS